MSKKNSSDPIRIRNRNLPACTTLSQATAQPRIPSSSSSSSSSTFFFFYLFFFFSYFSFFFSSFSFFFFYFFFSTSCFSSSSSLFNIEKSLILANMKGTIYGNRLPSGTQLKKCWEPLFYSIRFNQLA
jgi:hypothetical protein